MNLEALNEILANQEDILEDSANDNGTDIEVAFGIARDAAANGYDSLSNNQKYHFDNCIRHLIEDVNCDGYRGAFGEEDPHCQNVLDDDDLADCYRQDSFLCEGCESEASGDIHSRDRIMED